MKKINFKQPKYVLPALLYPLVAFVGYMVIDMCNFETPNADNPNLKTTDYLSSDLPEANTDSILGSKMDNTTDMYGRISDLSGVDNIENDRDSVNKKEDYDSRYSGSEAERVAKQNADEEERRKLRQMQNRVRQERKNTTSNDFVAQTGDSEIEQLQRQRRQRSWEEMDRDLAGTGRYISRREDDGSIGSTPSVTYDENGNITYNVNEGMPSRAASSDVSSGESVKDAEIASVKKKTKDTSDYFNTIGGNSSESKLITAIIDEDIKAVDGSRVRLRLLDDIEIDGTTVKKGTYLYATMSGFGKQRVNGKVESVFFDEDIIKVSLSIYDTDGQEGLYVPQSSFKETSKDVLSTSLSGGRNILDNTTSSSGIKGWASQAAQNMTTKAMSALGKAARKNRVKLKYGTKVYLVDASSIANESKNRKR